MVVHDYLVRRRTLEELEREALRLRKEWGLTPTAKLDVFELMFSNMPEALRKTGLKLVERSAGFMGDREAYAAPRSKRIFYRASLLARLKLGQPAAAIIFLHELAHMVMHPGGEKAWIVSGNETPKYISEEESSEKQATRLALCLKAPKATACNCVDAAQLAQEFGLISDHAVERFETLKRQGKRALPESYYSFKREIDPKRNFPNESHHITAFTVFYIQDPCSHCGRRLLRPVGSKYWCDGCQSLSDRFQDGDLVGFELW